MEGARECAPPDVVRARGASGMKPISTVLARRGKTGAVRPNQPTGRVSASDEKASFDRKAKGLRTVWTARGFLLVQIAMFLVLATIHFGLLIDGYRHAAAGTTELVIAVLLVFGLLLTWTPPPWSRRAATAAQLPAWLLQREAPGTSSRHGWLRW